MEQICIIEINFCTSFIYFLSKKSLVKSFSPIKKNLIGVLEPISYLTDRTDILQDLLFRSLQISLFIEKNT